MKQNELVKEIHNTFETEVDRLLEYAGIPTVARRPDKAIIRKADRLKAMGFIQAADVKSASVEEGLEEAADRENFEKRKLTKAINYFSQKYPLYKFITFESVERICGKYGLVLGKSADYTGDVPEINLVHMENFKIDENDAALQKANLWTGLSGDFVSGAQAKATREQEVTAYPTLPSLGTPGIIQHKYRRSGMGYDLNRLQEQAIFEDQMRWFSGLLSGPSQDYKRCPLEIVATPKDFNMTGKHMEGISIVENDPIVLQPVVFEKTRYYLVVTAWGLEASDKEVVNPAMN